MNFAHDGPRAHAQTSSDMPAAPRLAGPLVLHTDLASWLLARESGAESDGPGLSAAAERVCQLLCRRLSRSVSAAGAQAVLARALHLSRARFPFLEEVHAGLVPAPCLDGLPERVHGLEADEVGDGLLTLLGTLLDLLVGFIGEDLTLRLARDVWPDLPRLQPSRTAPSDG